MTINVIFLKFLCGDIYNDHFKVKPRAVSKGVWRVSHLPWKRFLSILPLPLGAFAI